MTAAEALRAALSGERRERAVALSLVVYAVAWAAYGTIAKSGQGLHPDMVEVIVWSRDLAWGYLKHPPLAAALVWAWFEVFPVAEWSYYLLAMTMPALALWVVWRLTADYLDIEKRIASLMLLMLVPFFNFHALKFNVNTVLMPLWAVTTLWFLRAYRTRALSYAALAGFGAALCMLGKYWSVFLLAGLLVAALIDTRRAAYFKSPAPWITVIVGLAALSPHLLWLWRNDFAPFSYAMTVHGDKSIGGTAYSALGYLAGSVGHVALPVILVFMVLIRDSKRDLRATFADMVWPHEQERRLAAAAFWAPFLLPAVGAIAGGAAITSLWSMSAWTLLPVLLLSPPAVTWREVDTRRVLLLTIALSIVMLMAAPFIAHMNRPSGPPRTAARAPALALQVERLWRQTTLQPLRFIGGDGDIVYDVTAYAGDKPRAVQQGLALPNVDMLKRAGIAVLCYADDKGCEQNAVQAAGAAAKRVTIAHILDKGARGITVIVVPPQP